jgi:hypothetical protein
MCALTLDSLYGSLVVVASFSTAFTAYMLATAATDWIEDKARTAKATERARRRSLKATPTRAALDFARPINIDDLRKRAGL